MGTRRSPTAQLRSASTALGPKGKIVEHTFLSYHTVAGATDAGKAQSTYYGNWLTQWRMGLTDTHQPMGFDQLGGRYADCRVLDTTFELHVRPAAYETSAAAYVPCGLVLNVLPIPIKVYTVEPAGTMFSDMERVGAITKYRIAAETYGSSTGTKHSTASQPGYTKFVFKLKTSDILPDESKANLTQHYAKDNQDTAPPASLWALRLFINELSTQADVTVSFDCILKRVSRVLWTNRIGAGGS